MTVGDGARPGATLAVAERAITIVSGLRNRMLRSAMRLSCYHPSRHQVPTSMQASYTTRIYLRKKGGLVMHAEGIGGKGIGDANGWSNRAGCHAGRNHGHGIGSRSG
jgi:hypothetical protein